MSIGCCHLEKLLAVYQYIASSALGESAFAGGIATALLGILFHFIISFVVAGVFILSANRIPLLRRYPIVGALLYGFGVFIVMNSIVIPLSAAPPLPVPTTPQLIMYILEHILVIGLPLGILGQRNANRIYSYNVENQKFTSKRFNQPFTAGRIRLLELTCKLPTMDVRSCNQQSGHLVVIQLEVT